ncbi:hypothetical protein RR48_00497 [Papilio machaon]|uniref:Uncharacterized protein n=1 Tax=Papilio machaon TaxID=76193 RepID=A0A0N1IHV5_PAPMA|nr:hypothetical protein RR48_00497 [Papilio machaon]
MCRIFNEETARLEQYNSVKKFKTNEDHSKQRVRTKRNVDSLNPTVKVEDIRRVEGIVNKLYDDMDGNGKVTYRQRLFDTTTTEKGKALLGDRPGYWTERGRHRSANYAVSHNPVNLSSSCMVKKEGVCC